MLCRQYKNAYSVYFLKHEEVIKELRPLLFRLPKRIKARGMTSKFHILSVGSPYKILRMFHAKIN